jgi:hypothetical protein
MTIEKQRTFGDAVGMAPVVETTARLPLDLVECSDGTFRADEDVHYDCRDNPHGTEEDRLEADVTIVTDLLNDIGKWADEYCTGNTDYVEGYYHIVDEVSHDWPAHIREWIDNKYGDVYGISRFRNCIDKLVDTICENVDGSFDTEPEYHSNEYACYSGKGCCLFSFDIGEYEEQIDVESHDDLLELHERGDLDTVLDNVNCDVYVSRSKRRVKNETTGHYEQVGRETYNPYDREHPTFEVYTNPGGQWMFVVSEERMEELLVNAIIECARHTDSRD